MSTEKDATGFMNRWSARKHNQAKTAIEHAEPLMPAQADPLNTVPLPDHPLVEPETEALNESLAHTEALVKTDSHDPAQAVTSEDVLLCDDDMPSIDSLHANSDISDFLNKGVSAALRRAALRHVFQQPEYNVRDGLNDYDGDYTVFEPLGDTITSDMKWHTARKERARLAAEQEAAEQEAEALTARQADDSDELAQSKETEAPSEEETHTEESSSQDKVVEHTDAENIESDPTPLPDPIPEDILLAQESAGTNVLPADGTPHSEPDLLAEPARKDKPEKTA